MLLCFPAFGFCDQSRYRYIFLHLNIISKEYYGCDQMSPYLKTDSNFCTDKNKTD